MGITKTLRESVCQVEERQIVFGDIYSRWFREEHNLQLWVDVLPGNFSNASDRPLPKRGASNPMHTLGEPTTDDMQFKPSLLVRQTINLFTLTTLLTDRSSTGFFCGKYDINSGSVFIHGCYNDEVSQTAVNPSFIGYDKLPASVTSSFSHPTSSSDSSDNSDLALGVGVIVGGIVAVVLAIWFFWWFCCMRPRNSWWNKRKGKYTPLPDPSQTGYTAPYGASSQTAFPSPAPYSNMGYQMGPVSSPTQNTYGGPTYHEISAVAPPVEAAAASSRPTSNLEWQQTNPGKTVTYRVEYIPANFTPEDVKSRLFSLTDRLRVTVRSLAPSILGDDKQIATIDFPSWNKNSSGPSLSSDAKALNITSVDRDFRGWTPLNRAHEPIVAE